MFPPASFFRYFFVFFLLLLLLLFPSLPLRSNRTNKATRYAFTGGEFRNFSLFHREENSLVLRLSR